MMSDETLKTIIASKGEGVPPEVIVKICAELLKLRADKRSER